MEEQRCGEEEEGECSVAVWSWGAGTDGQLATGLLRDEHLPQLLPSFGNLPISRLSCGGAHAIALTSGGRVMTWGRGKYGQLGHGDLENNLQPKPVKFLDGIVICNIAAGWNHSGFVSDNGCLFTCGDGSFGQLGHGDYQSRHIPVEVTFFVSNHVAEIACGMRHSLVLLNGPPGDSVYAFGSGRHGQLGISSEQIRKSFNVPQVIHGFDDNEIFTISANGDQSAALSSNGSLYTWGRGFNGNSSTCFPHLQPLSLRISQIALGWHHALLLTDCGEVFTLVGDRRGMLGVPEHVNLEQQAHLHYIPSSNSDEICKAPYLYKVSILGDAKVVAIAAGAEHCAMVTENAVMMTWGWGEHGQLGLGSSCNQTCPQIVPINNNSHPNPPIKYRVYCGSGFTFAVATVSTCPQC